MNKDIENIIKNLPKYKNGSKAIPKDDIVVQYSALSLITDEVIKKFIDYLELNPNEDGSTSPNIPHWIEKKQSQLRKLLSIVSPNKENKK